MVSSLQTFLTHSLEQPSFTTVLLKTYACTMYICIYLDKYTDRNIRLENQQWPFACLYFYRKYCILLAVNISRYGDSCITHLHSTYLSMLRKMICYGLVSLIFNSTLIRVFFPGCLKIRYSTTPLSSALLVQPAKYRLISNHLIVLQPLIFFKNYFKLL